MSEICPLRPVLCPFVDIGCSASLLYKDVPAHLDQCAPAHLILAIDRVRAQGVVIEKLFGRIHELEQYCNDNSARINGLAAASAAAVVAIEVVEKRMWSKCSDEIGRAERFVLLAPILFTLRSRRPSLNLLCFLASSRCNDKTAKVSSLANSTQTSTQNIERQLKPLLDSSRAAGGR